MLPPHPLAPFRAAKRLAHVAGKLDPLADVAGSIGRPLLNHLSDTEAAQHAGEAFAGSAPGAFLQAAKPAISPLFELAMMIQAAPMLYHLARWGGHELGQGANYMTQQLPQALPHPFGLGAPPMAGPGPQFPPQGQPSAPSASPSPDQQQQMALMKLMSAQHGQLNPQAMQAQIMTRAQTPQAPPQLPPQRPMAPRPPAGYR